MILYPLDGAARASESQPVPAWNAVEAQQRKAASEWYLVAQPDHAALAGDFAARIESALFPPLSREVVSAISLHDEGWSIFDAQPVTRDDGRPISFLEVEPKDFLRAWTGSIERAEQDSAIGGILVSEHFCRLGRSALGRKLSDDDAKLVDGFLDDESQRQARLAPVQKHSREQIEALTDVLQFCDLLSLYVCCGSVQPVEFPQKFKGQVLRLIHQANCCMMDPPVFGEGTSLAVSARKYPHSGSVEMPILLQ